MGAIAAGMENCESQVKENENRKRVRPKSRWMLSRRGKGRERGREREREILSENENKLIVELALIEHAHLGRTFRARFVYRTVATCHG